MSEVGPVQEAAAQNTREHARNTIRWLWPRYGAMVELLGPAIGERDTVPSFKDSDRDSSFLHLIPPSPCVVVISILCGMTMDEDPGGWVKADDDVIDDDIIA